MKLKKKQKYNTKKKKTMRKKKEKKTGQKKACSFTDEKTVNYCLLKK